MAHTPEQRSLHELCGARKRNGELCRKFAGEGTDHRGTGKCKYHGGATRSHVKSAARKEAAKRMSGFGLQMDITPAEALLSMVRISAGHVAYLQQEIELDSDDSPYERAVLWEAWNAERDRLTRTAKAAVESGCAIAQVRMAEHIGQLMGEVLRNVLFAQELALTAKQQKVLPKLVKTHLMAMERRHTQLRAADQADAELTVAG
jgi:hypothetical protein